MIQAQEFVRKWQVGAAAHAALDAAVAAACGWVDYAPAMADDEVLRRLLALNRARSGSGNAS